MALTAGQIPKVANVPNSGVGAVAASSNVVTLGADASGVDVYTAAATYGGRIYSVIANTNDTVAVNIFLWILDGATVIPLGIVNVPLSSGNLGTVSAVNMLDPSNANAALKGLAIDEQGNRYIPLKGGQKLRAGSLAGLTSAKTCWITAIGSDYQA
jgi:hypothetical protein